MEMTSGRPDWALNHLLINTLRRVLLWVALFLFMPPLEGPLGNLTRYDLWPHVPGSFGLVVGYDTEVDEVEEFSARREPPASLEHHSKVYY